MHRINRRNPSGCQADIHLPVQVLEAEIARILLVYLINGAIKFPPDPLGLDPVHILVLFEWLQRQTHQHIGVKYTDQSGANEKMGTSVPLWRTWPSGLP